MADMMSSDQVEFEMLQCYDAAGFPHSSGFSQILWFLLVDTAVCIPKFSTIRMLQIKKLFGSCKSEKVANKPC